jgi:hypothetical protein
MMIPGMGHDLPRAAWPALIDAIAGHVSSAGEAAASAPAAAAAAAAPGARR